MLQNLLSYDLFIYFFVTKKCVDKLTFYGAFQSVHISYLVTVYLLCFCIHFLHQSYFVRIFLGVSLLLNCHYHTNQIFKLELYIDSKVLMFN